MDSQMDYVITPSSLSPSTIDYSLVLKDFR